MCCFVQFVCFLFQEFFKDQGLVNTVSSVLLSKIKAEIFSANRWPSFYVLLFRMFILELWTIGVPNFRLFSWKSFFWLKVSVWNIKNIILFDSIFCKIESILLWPCYYINPGSFFAYLLSRPFEDDSASLSSELKFRAGPPMIVSAPGCK